MPTDKKDVAPPVPDYAIDRQWDVVARAWSVRLALAPTNTAHGWVDEWQLVCNGYNGLNYNGRDWTGCGQPLMKVHDESAPHPFQPDQLTLLLRSHLRREHAGITPQVTAAAARTRKAA